MLKITRDDEVIVIAGRDKGKRGKVLKVLGNGRLVVAGIQMVKKHQKGPIFQIRRFDLHCQLAFAQNRCMDYFVKSKSN